MPFAACALEAAFAVEGGAFEQRAAQEIAGAGKGSGEFIPFAGGAFACHLYR